MYKETFIQASTGQGKTYETFINAIFLATTFNKTCIISTSSKILVDQYFIEITNIYNKSKIKNFKLSDCLISIVKYTKDEPLTNNVLMDIFSKGRGIIITVHTYLHNFDDFNTPIFLIV